LAAKSDTNYWQYLNQNIGTYTNTPEGYLYRALSVIGGGFANLADDAVYAQLNRTASAATLDGNNTYSLTFTVPAPSYNSFPVTGILPPQVSNSAGNP
jgi:hypothetical protein